MRGRLINPGVVEIARISTVTADYDSTYDELKTFTDIDGNVVTERPEQTTIRLRAQVDVEDDDRLQITGTALDVARQMTLVFHYRELERQNLVDRVTGKAMLNKGDRILAFYDVRGVLLEQVVYPPGLYAVHVKNQPIGIGRSRNLLKVTFAARESGTPL